MFLQEGQIQDAFKSHLTPINRHEIFFALSYFSKKIIRKWGALNQIYEYPCGPKKTFH